MQKQSGVSRPGLTRCSARYNLAFQKTKQELHTGVVKGGHCWAEKPVLAITIGYVMVEQNVLCAVYLHVL